MNIQSVIDLDQRLLPLFNGSDSAFMDGWMAVLTSGITWIPLYMALLYLVVKNNESMAQILLTIGCVALCFAISDIVADFIVKPLISRLRPGNDPMIKYTVHVVRDIRGTDFSFFSAHASNTFSLAIFFCLLVRSRMLNILLVLWSLMNCYTRLYLGVHYLSDVAAGLIWGGIAAVSAYLIYRKAYEKITPPLNYVSSQYTATGYLRNDIEIVTLVLLATMVYTVFRAIFFY